VPESIDWPPQHQAWPRSRRRFLLIIAVLAGIFFGGPPAVSYYVARGQSGKFQRLAFERSTSVAAALHGALLVTAIVIFPSSPSNSSAA